MITRRALFYKNIHPFIRAPPHDPNTPWHWGLGFEHMDFGGIHSTHNSILFFFVPCVTKLRKGAFLFVCFFGLDFLLSQKLCIIFRMPISILPPSLNHFYVESPYAFFSDQICFCCFVVVSNFRLCTDLVFMAVVSDELRHNC